jgi:hypothetical protein
MLATDKPPIFPTHSGAWTAMVQASGSCGSLGEEVDRRAVDTVGVSPPGELCGRSLLYSSSQASTILRAASRIHLLLRHSSRGCQQGGSSRHLRRDARV